MSRPKRVYTIQDAQMYYLHITESAWEHEYAEARLLGVAHRNLYSDVRRRAVAALGKMADRVKYGNVVLYVNIQNWMPL